MLARLLDTSPRSRHETFPDTSQLVYPVSHDHNVGDFVARIGSLAARGVPRHADSHHYWHGSGVSPRPQPLDPDGFPDAHRATAFDTRVANRRAVTESIECA